MSATPSFAVVVGTLTVAAASSSTPAGTWSIAAATSAAAIPLPSTRTATALVTDCASTPGQCALSWSIAGQEGLQNEYFWGVAVSATDWDPVICTDASTSSTYSITVAN